MLTSLYAFNLKAVDLHMKSVTYLTCWNSDHNFSTQNWQTLWIYKLDLFTPSLSSSNSYYYISSSLFLSTMSPSVKRFFNKDCGIQLQKSPTVGNSQKFPVNSSWLASASTPCVKLWRKTFSSFYQNSMTKNWDDSQGWFHWILNRNLSFHPTPTTALSLKGHLHTSVISPSDAISTEIILSF
jgi:hypothetical protein